MSQLVLTAATTATTLVAAGGSTATQVIASTAANLAANYALSQAQALIYGPQKRQAVGPRIESFRLQASTEGAPMPRLYGRSRLAGQVIWASKFREETQTNTTSTGGKGSRPKVETTTTEYLYSISLAIGLCEGEIDRIGRVWADGKAISLQNYTWRLYKGDETQMPDSAIEAVEGAGLAPAYRGLAYIVFEDLPLAAFGNRIPQFTFEVERSLRTADPTALENAITAVTMIPGAGEAVYGTSKITVSDGEGTSRAENVNNNQAGTDFIASVETLGEALPACRHVALIVSWFGDDLRAGHCRLRPGVEVRDKETVPSAWTVAGEDRAGAWLVSQNTGGPAYGGTPSDASVIQAIQHLKAEGFEVMFYPFILMDIPHGNQLPDGQGGTGQPAYPWRGRIDAGAEDGTAAVRAQVNAFFGTAQGEGLRRMILHYAALCEEAGGVSSFLIGTEMRGLTTIRDGAGAYPAVEEFQALAGEVRAIVGSQTEISYAADWSEYFGHQPADGSGDVFFHLDDLWVDENIDFIGIDNYMPLSDWRDGQAHIDFLAGTASGHDRDYLASNIEGGEGYDWYYASSADRDAQIRTPITDGAYGEPWIYRYKGLRSWWENPHHNRPGGVRNATPTAWVPRAKPFRFTELGCAAVDKAANQPNVFIDPKSSETALPHYSGGGRDDLIQRRFVEAHINYWSQAANNPISPVYNGEMVDSTRIFIYTWDARPYPAFPALVDVWADGPNWSRGHWLTGRVGQVPLDLLVRDIAERSGLPGIDVDALEGLVTGFVIDRPMSARTVLEPLAGLYQFDAVERGEQLVFVPRGTPPLLTLTADEMVAEDQGPYRLTTAQAGDLPVSFTLSYLEEGRDYQRAVSEVRRPDAPGERKLGLETPVILAAGEAQGRAEMLLADALAMAETISFALPASQMPLEPTDVIRLQTTGGSRDFRILEIADGDARQISAVATRSELYSYRAGPARSLSYTAPVVHGTPIVEMLDLPLVTEDGVPALYAAAFARPWPGGVALYRAAGSVPPALETTLARPAVMGRLVADLAPGPVTYWDRANDLQVRLTSGAFEARTELEVLNGANLLAIEGPEEWELLQFTNAQLLPDGTWQLSGLLRGLAGTAVDAISIGARVVLMEEGVQALPFAAEDRLREVTRQGGPEGELVGGDNFISVTNAFVGTGWRPLSPVHLRVRRVGSAYEISWVRRTRINGDSWELAEVPLGEEREAYRVEIREDDMLVHTEEVSTPSYTYIPGAGAALAELTVAQLSAIYGPGRAASLTLSLL